MYRALVRKELRQLLPLIVLAALAYGYMTFLLCLPELRDDVRKVPLLMPLNYLLGGGGGRSFVGSPFLAVFYQPFCFISVPLAIIAGFLQTLGESRMGTSLFWLHRPVSRTGLVGVKLAVGLTVYIVLASMPIIFCAIWTAIPGHYPAPFEWSMTYKAWWILLDIGLLYLAAFLSGIRPARWFGSRLLPLVVGIFLSFLAVGRADYFLFIILISAIAFFWAIIYVANSRDFS
jgi:ABC-2 family transporter protein